MNDSLFSHLLGDTAWQQLPPVVQTIHGAAARLETRGITDVTGASHLPARWLRRLLNLPQPGTDQPLTVTFERHDTYEVWTRRFNHRRMRSVLSRRDNSPLLYEQLGPASLGFALHRDGDTIDWQLRSVHLLGLPLPRALQGKVLSRSGVRDGRYRFQVNVRLPWLGQLVAYDGWLEVISDG